MKPVNNKLTYIKENIRMYNIRRDIISEGIFYNVHEFLLGNRQLLIMERNFSRLIGSNIKRSYK